MKRLLVCMIAVMSFMANSMAVEFAVIGSVSKVYEEPSQSSAICNQFDDAVYVQPGMAFVKTGETQNYWKVKFPGWGNGVYIPKKSCVGSETLDITDGDYVMKSGDDEYVVKIVSNGETYKVEYNFSSFYDTLLVGKMVTPEVMDIVCVDWDNKEVGTVTRINGKIYVWIYDDFVLGWD